MEKVVTQNLSHKKVAKREISFIDTSKGWQLRDVVMVGGIAFRAKDLKHLFSCQDFQSLRKQHGLGDIRKVVLNKGEEDGLGLSITVRFAVKKTVKKERQNSKHNNDISF